MRYQQIAATKTKAASTIKSTNPELAAELEEIADEMLETKEKFIALSTQWDAWGRPDPDLAVKLRDSFNAKNTEDPNFAEHKGAFMKVAPSCNHCLNPHTNLNPSHSHSSNRPD